MGENYFHLAREWGYRAIPRRILVEEILSGPAAAYPWITSSSSSAAGRGC